MGLDIRQWMLLAGGVLFLLVVIDGVRRVLADRKEEVRLSKNARKGFPPIDDGDASEPKNSELLGRARVVTRNINSANNHEDDDVPVLLDTVDPDEIDALTDAEAAAQQPSQGFEKPSELSQGALALNEPEVKPEPSISLPETEHEIADEPLGEVEDVVVINVHAPQGEDFNGQEMLETLLNHDVRFGNMDIFHKRESLDDSKRVQFSIVNSVEPGTFSLDDFDTFTTPGVTFFMQLPGPKKPMDAFKAMLAVADALAQSTGGTMLDEQRNPISQQTLEHMKQQVENFERRSLAKRPS